jgi:hypothetical protein
MTREEIIAMEPGRKLDTLVAEKVMGLTVYHYDKDVEENCYYMLMDTEGFPFEPFGGEKETEEEAWLSCFYYSTDISAAWEVVEKIKKDLDWWIVLNSEGEKWIALFYWDKYQIACECEAETASEAICKCALMAVMDKEDEA